MNVIFYLGQTLEEFDSSSKGTGIGGSEEAVIAMKEQLEKKGHSVIVYGCPKEESDSWRFYEDVGEIESTDVLIVWRNPQSIKTQLSHIKAKYKWLWLHDTTPEVAVNRYAVLYDKILVLSSFHRAIYPSIEDELFLITRNGIDLSQFKKKVERNQYKMIYASSYDRGLLELLENWTYIKTRVPKAELHVYYGWNTADALNDDKTYASFKRHIENLLDQEGVFHHGRVGHEELAGAFLSSQIWAYPTWWPETSCITAMKAQAGGAVPVVIPAGALGETVKIGWKSPFKPTDYGVMKIPDYVMDNYLKTLVYLLKNPEAVNNVRPVMQDMAKQFDWSNVANQWEKQWN